LVSWLVFSFFDALVVDVQEVLLALADSLIEVGVWLLVAAITEPTDFKAFADTAKALDGVAWIANTVLTVPVGV
jgi:hypothetical protein